MSARFGRLLTAMITPFHKSGEVDYEGAESLASTLIEDGHDGLVICGTTGEAPTLTTEEKLELWTRIKKVVGAEVPIIAGTGSYCTRSTVDLSVKAQDTGIDALLLVAPYYNKPSGQGMLNHFSTIHEATSVPIMLYNIPGRTGVEIPVDVLAELAALPRMVAVKQSLPIDPVSRLASRLDSGAGQLETYSGDDSQTLPQLAIGGSGVVSVAGHVAGPMIKSMITAFFEGRVAEAACMHRKLFPLFEVLFCTSNPVPVKVALELMGRPSGVVRQPLCQATSEEYSKVKAVMESLGLLS